MSTSDLARRLERATRRLERSRRELAHANGEYAFMLEGDILAYEAESEALRERLYGTAPN